ncbi:DUF3108 domain-containing protein [Rhizobium sp. SSA_523]|uniref:DUF3108 domain-containing protein n=1 Tax=Rhizobium sp. SSA_523 TaxID=2952477 RepID=UPI00209109CE|nr:DUF3108 domain-containing protein [Rhizobium sp. SSA_523]MCO5733660.1 DUF3108 domain-containing protein [Rhizobium sp. SSA_523]WKC23046.1 DUF3108 domain-containing protein [Rhizobium sp. SSA_523]
MLRRSRISAFFALGLLSSAAVGLSASPAVTAGTRHFSEYDVSLGLLPIARASFASEFDGRSYTISGVFRSSGLVNLFTRISADTNVKGTIRGRQLQADAYSLTYTQGKKTRIYDIAYRNGDVVSSTIKPEPGQRPPNWVPVSAGDLQAVLDPLSSLVFPAGAKVCPSRLPIYDGESRMDLVLTPKGKKTFSTDGFKGEALVCEVRYRPRSGYRQGRSDIEFLKQARMEVWFAKASGPDVYAPVYARVPTKVGDVYVTAVKYGG